MVTMWLRFAVVLHVVFVVFADDVDAVDADVADADVAAVSQSATDNVMECSRKRFAHFLRKNCIRWRVPFV